VLMQQVFFSRSYTLTFCIKKDESGVQHHTKWPNPGITRRNYSLTRRDISTRPAATHKEMRFQKDAVPTEASLLTLPKARSFLYIQRLQVTPVVMELKARRLGLGTCFLVATHRSTRWSFGSGTRCPPPQLFNALNHTSLEKAHCRNRWSMVSSSLEHNMHSTKEHRPCRHPLSAVQHLPSSSIHMKKRHFAAAFDFHNWSAPSTADCYTNKIA
jgi:hypothetical protein